MEKLAEVPVGDSALAARLRREIEGDVLFDAFSRGRYSTDASIYQIEPIGVAIPKSPEELRRIIQIAAQEQLPIVPRGGASSGASGFTHAMTLTVSRGVERPSSVRKWLMSSL